MLKKSLLALLPLAILAGGWYFIQSKNTTSDFVSPDSVATNNSSSTDNSRISTIENPLAPEREDSDLLTESTNNESTKNDSTTTTGRQPNQTTESVVDSSPATSTNSVEPSSVAVEPLSDAEFIRLERLIKNDQQLRLSLLEEFRYNTDPVRAQQLAALLGPYDDPEILQIASELTYSGDTQSQVAGLDLLSRIQPRSDDARNIAIDLLSAGDTPEILKATMNVLATPSRRASDSQIQILNDNLNNLSNHYDSSVRAQSIALLGRWDKNSSVARDAFSRGLNDSDPNVRSSTTFAINNIRNPDEAMISDLLTIAENTDEIRTTRYAALRALENMQLTGTSIRRYAVAKRSANTR